jgi:hypothetical protein
LKHGVPRRACRWVFHSLLSIHDRQEDEYTECGGFIGEDYERVKIPNKRGPEIDAVLAKIEGHSFYSGFHRLCFLSNQAIAWGRQASSWSQTAMYRKRRAVRANAMSSRGFVNMFKQAILPRSVRYDCGAESGGSGRLVEFSKADSRRHFKQDVERSRLGTICRQHHRMLRSVY